MPKGKAISYTIAELEWIKSRRTLTRRDLHTMFCETFDRSDVSQQALTALCKRNNWLTGRTGKFKKGNIPAPNARPKGPNATSFKPGQRPPNLKPMFYERTNKDGYIEIKVPEVNPHTGHKTRFRLKHAWVWEQHNGPLPPGHAIAFRDGDPLNTDISNLICVPRSVLARMNKIYKCGEHHGKQREAIIAMALIDDKTQKLRADN